MNNSIIFIDFDYFYAQVEEIFNPDLKGKPVVVCVYSGRTETSGAVATSNYIAREMGIKSGMPLPNALSIGKDKAVFLPIRRDFYKEFSDRVMGIISSFSDIIEIASIDEAYLDVSDKCRDINDAVLMAKDLKQKIFNETGLRVSIGISINKVFAKILGDMAKPDGMKWIGPEDADLFLRSLKIKQIPGIGTILSGRLNEAGVNYLMDVKNIVKEKLMDILGHSKYKYIMDIINNNYNPPVISRTKKNFGKYVTLSEDTRNINNIMPYLLRDVELAFEKLPGTPSEISVIAITEDMDIISRSYTGMRIDKKNAMDISVNLLNKILEGDARNIRRIGIRLGKLTKNESLDDFF